MEIQTQTDMPLRHRHFLAVPVLLGTFVAIAGLDTLLAHPVMDASATQVLRTTDVQADSAQTYQEASGLRAELTEGTYLRDQWGTLQLFQGTAFVSGPLTVRVQVDDIVLRGFHGAYQVYASASSDSIAVYAVSTPVLIEQGETSILLPAGTQVAFEGTDSVADVHPIPEQQLRDLLLRARQIGDVAAAPQTNADAGIEEALARAAQEPPSVAADLMGSLTDPWTWLILSFHPDFREAAWSVPGPRDIPLSVRQKRWLLFASPYTGERGPLGIRRWADEVQKFVLQDPEAMTFLDALFARLVDFQTTEGEAQADSVRQMRDALQDAFQGFPVDTLSPETRQHWNTFFSAGEILPYVDVQPVEPEASASSADAPASSSSASAEKPLTAAEAAEVAASAKETLSQNGGLFTGRTSVTALSRTTVQVRDIIFADATGEHTYAFALDLAHNQVQKIERDKQLLPYYLPLDLFSRWARGVNE